MVILPGWPGQPRVVGRDDGCDEITVELTRRWEGEQIRTVRLRNGRLSVIHLTTVRGRRPQRLSPGTVEAVVRVPMTQLGTIQVLARGRA